MDLNDLKINGERKRKNNFPNQVVNTGDLSVGRICGFVQLSKKNYKNSDDVKRFKKSEKDFELSKLV